MDEQNIRQTNMVRANVDWTDIREREIKPRQQGDPLATVRWNNQLYAPEEVAELQRRYVQQGKDKWEQTTQGKLCLAFYRAFMEYKKFFEENTFAQRDPLGQTVSYDEHKLFEVGLRMVETHRQEREEVLRRNLEKAQQSARCRHMHMNGKQCGAPRVKGKKLCHVHERMQQVKTAALDLGPMEDPDSIQLGIRMLQSAIIEGKLDYRQVGQLAYTIQLAAWNVMRTSTVAREE
jgi:hypothetical protein